MKIPIIILLLVTGTITSYSQKVMRKFNNDDKSLRDSIQVLTSEVKNVKNFVKETISIFENMKGDKKKLEEQIEQATSTINFLNSNIAAIGVFLGLYVVILGLAIFFLGIKPAQDAVDRLEKNMDARISTYLENDRIKRIDVAVDSLDGHTELRRTMSIQFLADQSIAQPLTDAQYLKIFHQAKTSQYDDVRRGATGLLFRLDQNSSIYPIVDDYFMRVVNNEYVLNEDKTALSQIVWVHLLNVSTNNQKILRVQESVMKRAEEPYYMIRNMLNFCKSKELFLQMTNSSSIVESYLRPTDHYDIKLLTKRDGESRLSEFREIFIKLGGTQQEFEQTLLARTARRYIETN